MVRPENMYTSNIKEAQQVIFGNIYVHANVSIHVITFDETRSHKFEGQQGGVYERIWRDEKKRRNIIIIKSQK